MTWEHLSISTSAIQGSYELFKFCYPKELLPKVWQVAQGALQPWFIIKRGSLRRRSKGTSRREKVSESNTYSHLSLFSSLLLSVSNRLFCPHLSALARSLSSYLCDSATLRSFLLLLIHSRGSQMTTWSDAARCLLNFAAVLIRWNILLIHLCCEMFKLSNEFHFLSVEHLLHWKWQRPTTATTKRALLSLFPCPLAASYLLLSCSPSLSSNINLQIYGNEQGALTGHRMWMEDAIALATDQVSTCKYCFAEYR